MSIHAITSYRKNKKLLNYIKSKTSRTNNKISYTIQSNDFWGYIYLINDLTGDLYCIRPSFNMLEKLKRKTFTNTAKEVVSNINIQEITRYYSPDIVNYLGLLKKDHSWIQKNISTI